MTSHSISRRLLTSVALACTMLPAAALASPATSAPMSARADAKAELAARYEALRIAIASRKGDRIRPLLAPGFSRTDLGGNTMDAERMIGKLATIPLDPDRTSTTTIESLTVSGDTAQVEHRQDARQVRAGTDGVEHTMALTTLARDTWVRTGKSKAWRLKTTQDEQTTITRDGVVVRTMKRGDAIPSSASRASRGDVMGPSTDVMQGR